jgi:hypothetical protein
MEPTQSNRPLRTIVDRYGWPKVLAAAAVIGLAAGGIQAEISHNGGPDTSSPQYKAGYHDAYHWSLIYENADTALNDCEAGVAHDDKALYVLSEESVGWSGQQYVAWSQGCVAALRDFGMGIPQQSWEN